MIMQDMCFEMIESRRSVHCYVDKGDLLTSSLWLVMFHISTQYFEQACMYVWKKKQGSNSVIPNTLRGYYGQCIS